jgi:hypothetical protein
VDKIPVAETVEKPAEKTAVVTDKAEDVKA